MPAEAGSVQSRDGEETASGETHRSGEGKVKLKVVTDSFVIHINHVLSLFLALPLECLNFP